MTVQELIDELLTVENKNLKIVLDVDHGQTPMSISYSGVGYVEDVNQYMMERIHEDDAEEFDADEVYVLAGY